MKLDEHYMRLIAVGASVAANCQPCLEINLARAKECGSDDDELAQAVWVGRMVRKGAATKLDEFASNLFKSIHASATTTNADCGCESKGK
jgi:AhpD family alkylhydroperoxidase